MVYTIFNPWNAIAVFKLMCYRDTLWGDRNKILKITEIFLYISVFDLTLWSVGNLSTHYCNNDTCSNTIFWFSSVLVVSLYENRNYFCRTGDVLILSTGELEINSLTAFCITKTLVRVVNDRISQILQT